MRRIAEIARSSDTDGPTSWQAAVTLRLAQAGDGSALQRLAQLDSCPLPPGPHLVAERDGRIDAALSLNSREVVANPFRRTAELCDLLRRHAVAMETPPIARDVRIGTRLATATT